MAKKPIKMRSKFEEGIYAEAVEKGLTLEYEPKEPKIRYVLPVASYTPDFKLPNGILIEGKGWFRPRDQAKMARVRKQHPNLDIRFVFQKATSKATKTLTYAQWAEKYGFGWAEKSIPEEWFNEPYRVQSTGVSTVQESQGVSDE